MKDQWKTSVGNHATNRTQHSEDASPETQSKSYDQGKQPFLRSKNPIQVNLFGEQHLMCVFFAPGATIDPIDLGWPRENLGRAFTASTYIETSYLAESLEFETRNESSRAMSCSSNFVVKED